MWRPAGELLHAGHLPTLARFLAMESRVRRGHGNLEGAVSSALDAFELGLKVSEAAGMQERFAGWSSAEMGLAEMEAHYGELPAEVLEKHLPRVRRLRKGWPKLADPAARDRPQTLDSCRDILSVVEQRNLWRQLETREEATNLSGGKPGGGVRLYR